MPGKPADSLLIKAVSQTDARLKMPMGSPKLKDEEIADLSHWIEIGAPWPESKQPCTKGLRPIPRKSARFGRSSRSTSPAVPAVKDPAWAKTPIDHFILAKLEAAEAEAPAASDKRVLIRRATYDLTGLPPTPEEIEAFENDTSPDAYAKVVDRLLASPHYGERWGRHWLDVARYADGDGPEDKPKQKARAPEG